MKEFFGFTFLVLIISIIGSWNFKSCSTPDEKYLILKKQQIDDGYIYIVHNSRCLDAKDSKIYQTVIDFTKLKYYKYCDVCLDTFDIEWLDDISISNINRLNAYANYDITIDDDEWLHSDDQILYDRKRRGHNVYYYKKDSLLYEL